MNEHKRFVERYSVGRRREVKSEDCVKCGLTPCNCAAFDRAAALNVVLEQNPAFVELGAKHDKLVDSIKWIESLLAAKKAELNEVQTQLGMLRAVPYDSPREHWVALAQSEPCVHCKRRTEWVYYDDKGFHTVKCRPTCVERSESSHARMLNQIVAAVEANYLAQIARERDKKEG